MDQPLRLMKHEYDVVTLNFSRPSDHFSYGLLILYFVQGRYLSSLHFLLLFEILISRIYFEFEKEAFVLHQRLLPLIGEATKVNEGQRKTTNRIFIEPTYHLQ
jgi:hypothetical protein